MKTRLGGGGMAYSTDFLHQIEDDLRRLAIDWEKSGGNTQKAMGLLKAADIVKHIRQGNE